MDRRESNRPPARRDESGGRRPSQKELEAARKERERRRKEKLSRAAPPPDDTRERGRQSGREQKRPPARQTERSATRRPVTVAPVKRKEERAPRPKPVPTPPKMQEKPKEPRRPLPTGVRVLFVLVGLLAILGTLSLTVLFPITAVGVVGESRYETEKIVEESGIVTGQNLFLSGKDSAVRIQKELPYIKGAVVRKKLFSTVVIEVTEAVPYVCIKNENQWHVLDTDGKVLEKVDKPPKGMIQLSGISVDKAELGETIVFFEEGKARALWDLQQVLSTNQVQGITRIDLEDALDVCILYQNRLEIRLGIPSELDVKVRHVMTVIREEMSETDRGRVDISGGKRVTNDPSYEIKLPVEQE